MNTPTADEWTADTVIEMGGTTDWQVGNEIATAHNASIAAERECNSADFIDRYRDVEELRQQLAAERNERRLRTAQLAAAVEALKVAAGYVQKQFDNPKYTVSVYEPHLKQIQTTLAKQYDTTTSNKPIRPKPNSQGEEQ